MTELSPLIGRLTALRELLVGGNQLTCLPGEVACLPHLTVFSAYPNPFMTAEAMETLNEQEMEKRLMEVPSLREICLRFLVSPRTPTDADGTEGDRMTGKCVVTCR